MKLEKTKKKMNGKLDDEINSQVLSYTYQVCE